MKLITTILLTILLSIGIAGAVDVIDTTPANNQAGMSQDAGQSFTTPVLGVANQLSTITIRGPQSGAGATVYTLNVWADSDGNFATFDPGALVATSTNSIAIDTNNGDHVYTFSGEVLSDNTVYIFSFNDGSNHAGFRAGLTNAAGVAISDGALFSGGSQPFGGAFDVSFVLATVAPGGPANLVWTGATNGDWDTSTSNWALTDASPAIFSTDDLVTFNDAASTGIVTVLSEVQPGDFAVTNDTLDYSFGGAAIAGGTGLTKNGPGSLTLTGNNSFNGAITVSGGSLTAGDGATSGELGSGAVSLASGTSLTISRSDNLDYKASAKLREVSGAGDIFIDGGGLLFLYPGGGTGFNSPNTWAGFSGDITITNGSELQTIRNGATGRGSGTINLGDGSSSGSLSPIEGNWTWTNNINAIGSDNKIINRGTGIDRSLKLQGTISGAGNLTLEDATGAMSDVNRGFVITNDVSLTGTFTVASGAPVRIGGVPGEVDVSGTGLDAFSSGSLGTTTVVNNGTLTFSRTDAHTVAAPISGTGAARIGIPASANRGDTSTQVVTYADATKTYSGTTTVERGTLLVNGSLPNSAVEVSSDGVLGGSGTISQDTFVTGTVAPGASVGTLSFGDNVTFAAGSEIDWEISDFAGTAGGGYDTFIADSATFEGTATDPIFINIIPLSLANFTEGTSVFTLATAANPITTFDPEGFVVDDVDFATTTGGTGVWTVELSGDSLSVQLVYGPAAADDYDSWIGTFFVDETDPGIIGFDADPDKDGIPNGVENFLGTSPDGFSSGLEVVSATTTSVTASHSQSNEIASDITGGYQWSTDLQEWKSSGETNSGGVTATISTVVTDDQDAPDNDTVEVTATITGGASKGLYIRATATQTIPE